jgi:hypothetical protein
MSLAFIGGMSPCGERSRESSTHAAPPTPPRLLARVPGGSIYSVGRNFQPFRINDLEMVPDPRVMIGLILAAYSNLMPKDVGRWRASALAVARAQSVLRVGGWSMTLAGLAYAGLWAFTPLAFADVAAMAVVASAMLITMGYGGWTLLACRSKQTTAS